MLIDNKMRNTISIYFSFISLLLLLVICVVPGYSSDQKCNDFDEVERYNTINSEGVNLTIVLGYEPFFIFGTIKNLEIIHDENTIFVHFIALSIYFRYIYWSYFGPHAIEEWIYSEKVTIRIKVERIIPPFIGIVTKNFILGMDPAYPFFNFCCSD